MKSPEQISGVPERTESGSKEKETQITELDFNGLEIGDKITAKTAYGDEIGSEFEITVTGKRKNGLLVSVKSSFGEKQKNLPRECQADF